MLNQLAVVANHSVEKIHCIFLTILLPLVTFCGGGEIVTNGPITTRFVTESNIDQISKTIEIDGGLNGIEDGIHTGNLRRCWRPS